MARITEKWITEALIAKQLIPNAKAAGVDWSAVSFGQHFGLAWTLVESQQTMHRIGTWSTLSEAENGIRGMIEAFQAVARTRD